MRLVVGVSSAVCVILLVAAGCGGKASGGNGGGSSGSGGTGGSAGSGGTRGSGGSGGTVGSGGSAGASGSGGSSGSPIDAGMRACPGTPPSAGATCSPAGLWCEYGSDPNPYCNGLWQCGSSSSTWQDMTTKMVCAAPGSCPASYAAAMAVMGKCTAGQGYTCDYPQGTCICTDSVGPPLLNGPMWICTPPGSGCTSPRPELGTPCSTPAGTTCDYGACSGGMDEQCVDGHWSAANTACPG